MRRTRERFFTASLTSREKVGFPALQFPSSLLVFQGEDLEYTERNRYMQKTHRELFDKQVKEKRSQMKEVWMRENHRQVALVRANTVVDALENDSRRQYRLKLQAIKAANLAQARAKTEQMTKERREEMAAERQLMRQLSSRRSQSRGSLQWAF